MMKDKTWKSTILDWSWTPETSFKGSSMALESIAVTYLEGFTYRYTGMGPQILAPKKNKYTFNYSDIFYFQTMFPFKTK